jgi:anti-anti-sigma factor
MESTFSVITNNDLAKIELRGRLDANNAPALQDELKKLVGQPIKRLVFFAKDLEYISSAGLRTIIFAKQKIGAETRVFLIGAQEAILSVIRMSGLDTFMAIQDSFQE